MTGAQRGGWTTSAHEPTRVILLRHGQTPASVQRLYSGRGNPSLTDLGREQAAEAAALLRLTPIDAILSSPLDRARQTADAVAAGRGLTVEVDDDLIETDFGDWEGLSFGEARERDPELHARWLGDTAVAAPGGESFDEVHARVAALLVRVTAEHAGRTVLLVSHVTPIKTALRIALDVGPQLLYRLHLDLASISIADFYPDGGASVRQVNRTSGL
ncbi:bifunctional RNase H/acid phosphatase (plasmid) [Tsukamurella tyrosinosolvens]|uniref:Probable phosphoglycerate mutase n=1 Tax=Tsukamurella tyrosinosolvens TaxID=57704 RepID=A0A1H4XQG0_TSUTY|nr:phosphoglycerate kinase [Tsukamurella tyrosinosolvens]SED07952.1 probable phosphoglycerate mutase [Tsukamurella tyrosinosolvens]VEH97903.1 bifunctional RNase H/acid phosphatase [Tsukamurella tyrosinosolvens]